jgi:hypothetical protein
VPLATAPAPAIYSLLPIPYLAHPPYKTKSIPDPEGLDVCRRLEFSEAKMRFGPFLVISLLLLILWAGGFLMFHVASALIHLLLLFAVIAFVAHLLTGARTA